MKRGDKGTRLQRPSCRRGTQEAADFGRGERKQGPRRGELQGLGEVERRLRGGERVTPSLCPTSPSPLVSHQSQPQSFILPPPPSVAPLVGAREGGGGGSKCKEIENKPKLDLAMRRRGPGTGEYTGNNTAHIEK